MTQVWTINSSLLHFVSAPLLFWIPSRELYYSLDRPGFTCSLTLRHFAWTLYYELAILTVILLSAGDQPLSGDVAQV